MSGLTAYNLIDSDFITARIQVDSQTVKQTIQGVVDEFTIKTDELALKSNIQQNDPMLITETVYQGEINSFQNFSYVSIFKGDVTDERTWWPRLIVNAGSASVKTPITANNVLTSSVFDELVAIGVDDIRPFCIKNLDIEHEADLVDDKPTNDKYINHLTPIDDAYIARLELPSSISTATGLSHIQIHYNAIDLTGQVVAGTDLNDFSTLLLGNNQLMTQRHVKGHNGYLVVKKTVPSLSQVYPFQGGVSMSLADILFNMTQLTPNLADAEVAIKMKIISPGGIVDLPTQDFKRPIVSNVLQGADNGGKFPTPFVDVSDCIVTLKDSMRGYGKPKRIDNTILADQSTNSNKNLLTIESNIGEDLTDYRNSQQVTSNQPQQLPNTYSRTTHQVFEIIDNIVSQNNHEILVMPKNKKRSRCAE